MTGTTHGTAPPTDRIDTTLGDQPARARTGATAPGTTIDDGTGRIAQAAGIGSNGGITTG